MHIDSRTLLQIKFSQKSLWELFLPKKHWVAAAKGKNGNHNASFKMQFLITGNAGDQKGNTAKIAVVVALLSKWTLDFLKANKYNSVR